MPLSLDLGGRANPTVAAAWRRAWGRVILFFFFPPAIRKVINTTNAIESINAQLRKIIKTRGALSNRRCSDEVDLAGIAKYHRQLGQCRP
jgi:transposase-like protein